MAKAKPQITVDMLPDHAREYALNAEIEDSDLPFWWAAFELGRQSIADEGGTVAPRAPVAAPNAVAPPPGPKRQGTNRHGLTPEEEFPPQPDAMKEKAEAVEEEIEKAFGNLPFNHVEGDPHWMPDLLVLAGQITLNPNYDPVALEGVIRGMDAVEEWRKAGTLPGQGLIEKMFEVRLEKAGLRVKPKQGAIPLKPGISTAEDEEWDD